VVEQARRGARDVVVKSPIVCIRPSEEVETERGRGGGERQWEEPATRNEIKQAQGNPAR